MAQVSAEQLREYFAVLGLQEDASLKDICKAYRRLALQLHPDKNPYNTADAADKFKRIREAYGALRDHAERNVATSQNTPSSSSRGAFSSAAASSGDSWWGWSSSWADPVAEKWGWWSGSSESATAWGTSSWSRGREEASASDGTATVL